MAIRNFWVEARIDGRKTDLTGGPQGRDQGFSQTIYIRDRGMVLAAVSIRAYAKSDGTLTILVQMPRDSEHVSVEVHNTSLTLKTNRD